MASNDDFPVYVAQHHNGRTSSGPQPYLWHILVQTGTKGDEPIGIVYYLTGCPAQGWTFQATSRIRFRRTASYRGRTLIGWVEPKRLVEFELQLRQAEIVNFHTGWHSHHWVMNVIRRLVAQGFRVTHVSPEVLDHSLKEAERAWENFED